jgi:hypothetical protein
VDDDKYWGHVPLDSSIYTYLYQPEGSVLIFQDSLTGAIDTLQVFQTKLDTFSVTNDSGKLLYYGELWTQKERHSQTGYEFWMDSRSRNPSYYSFNMIHKYGFTPGLRNSLFVCSPFDLFLGESWNIYNTSVNTLSNYYDSITFDSTYYYNVYMIQTIDEITLNITDNKYYYARDHGLIRWEELNNQKIWKRVF